jgi:hypothetical protein
MSALNLAPATRMSIPRSQSRFIPVTRFDDALIAHIGRGGIEFFFSPPSEIKHRCTAANTI